MGRGSTPRPPDTLVGKDVTGTVHRVLPHGETFIRLDGSGTDGFYRQRYSERIVEGEALTVRVESYDAAHNTYRVRPI